MKSLRLHIHQGALSASLEFSRFPVLMGRDPRAECFLPSPSVSFHHARIDLRRGRLTLCDEGSSLGTWVHNHSRRLPVGVFLELDSVGNEFWIADLLVRAELCENVPVEGRQLGQTPPDRGASRRVPGFVEER